MCRSRSGPESHLVVLRAELLELHQKVSQVIFEKVQVFFDIKKPDDKGLHLAVTDHRWKARDRRYQVRVSQPTDNGPRKRVGAPSMAGWQDEERECTCVFVRLGKAESSMDAMYSLKKLWFVVPGGWVLGSKSGTRTCRRDNAKDVRPKDSRRTDG